MLDWLVERREWETWRALLMFFFAAVIGFASFGALVSFFRLVQ